MMAPVCGCTQRGRINVWAYDFVQIRTRDGRGVRLGQVKPKRGNILCILYVRRYNDTRLQGSEDRAVL